MSGPPPDGFREYIFARDRHACQRCRVGHSLTLSHRLDRSRGGGWWPHNIELLCGSGTTGCHGWREHHPHDAEAAGHRVAGRVVRGVYVGPDAAFAAAHAAYRGEGDVDWWARLDDLLTGRDALEA